jgi:hypothetical protein
MFAKYLSKMYQKPSSVGQKEVCIRCQEFIFSFQKYERQREFEGKLHKL